MDWLIAGLLAMAALAAIAVIAVLGRRWRPGRPRAGGTLLADLLYPPDAPPPQAAPPRDPPPVRETQRPPAREPQPPPAGEDQRPPPPPAGLPGRDDDWLASQLAWIAAWSQHMHEEISSAGGAPGDRGPATSSPPGSDPEAAE